MRSLPLLATVVAILAAGAIVMVEFWPSPGRDSQNRIPIGGPFTLQDHTGATRREAEFKGKLRLVFFGYTNCPDICPASLQTVSWTLEKLGDDAKMVAGIFITVDPARDTPKRLAVYRQSFDPRLVLLTGDEASIAKVKKDYRVVGVSEKGKLGSDGKPVENYVVNHTTLIYLFGPDGAYVAHFPHNAKPDELVKAIRKRL